MGAVMDRRDWEDMLAVIADMMFWGVLIACAIAIVIMIGILLGSVML